MRNEVLSMQKGKVPYNILKRSVLKHAIFKKSEVLVGAGIGKESSILSCKGNEGIAFSGNPVIVSGINGLYYGVIRCMNHLWASGAAPTGIINQILLPTDSEEKQLADIMKQLNDICNDLNIVILGGHTMVTDVVRQPVITLTAVGLVNCVPVKPQAGWDLIVTKYIGMEGTSLLVHEKEEVLHSHYTYDFLFGAKQMRQNLCVAQEANIAIAHGAAVHSMSEGGVLASLWDMMDGAGLGMDVNLKAIPIRQETVEITEFFELNPYQMMSNGALLVATPNGEELLQKLHREKIPATIIGKTTAEKARILRRDEEERYLDRPAMDDLYRTELLI